MQFEAEQITFRRDDTTWTAFAWDEVISWSLFITGGYQRDEVVALLAWLNGRRGSLAPDAVVVDVGANIGATSIPIAELTGRRVLAIEPEPENVAMLQRNIQQNGLQERIVVACVAVDDRRGTAWMVVPATNSGGAELCPAGAAPSLVAVGLIKRTIQVPTDTLDGILVAQGIGVRQVALVWSDTQGAEAHVIRSGAALWQAGVPLYIEFWPRALRRHGDLDDFIALLSRFFTHGIEHAALLRDGAAARPEPIAAVASLLRSLDGDRSTDVLLVPRGHDLPAVDS